MREIDSAVLKFVEKSLGIGRPATPTRPTVFDDDNLQQVLDVQRLVRRGSVLDELAAGFALLELRNAHAGASSETSNLDPYNDAQFGPTSAFAVNSWTGVPSTHEVWLLRALCQDRSGTDTLTEASLRQSFDRYPGIATDQAGSAVTSPFDGRQVFAGWDGTVTQINATYPNAAGELYTPLNIRWPRISAITPSDLIFGTTATGIGEFSCYVLIGILPIGLGQDLAI